jgi:hypothetical protein
LGTNRGKDVVFRHEDTDEIEILLKNDPSKTVKWLTFCDHCGEPAWYTEQRIRSGLICECLHSTRVCWYQMIRRCTDPRARDYPRWGGAGVKADPRWVRKTGFMIFVREFGVRPSSRHTIGRYLDLGHYFKINCKWMDREEQAEHQRLKRELMRRKAQ